MHDWCTTGARQEHDRCKIFVLDRLVRAKHSVVGDDYDDNYIDDDDDDDDDE